MNAEQKAKLQSRIAQARLQVAVEFCHICGRLMDFIGDGLYTCKPCNSEIVKSAILPEEN